MYATDGNGFDGFWFDDVSTKVAPKSSSPIIITNTRSVDRGTVWNPAWNKRIWWLKYTEAIFSILASYLKVKTFIARELSGFTCTSSNNEPEISIPYSAKPRGVLKISNSLLVSVGKSRKVTSNECVNIFIIQIEYTTKNRQQPKPWCNRPLSRGGHIESQGNKKLCFCPSSLALDERLDGQNLLFQHCVIKVYDSGVFNSHDNDIKEVVSSQPSITWCKLANLQKIGIRVE